MNKRVKIITAIVLAFVVSSLSSNSVFIAGTPRINGEFISSVITAPQRFLASLSNIANPSNLSFLNSQNVVPTTVPTSPNYAFNNSAPLTNVLPTNIPQSITTNIPTNIPPTSIPQSPYDSLINIPASQMNSVAQGVYAKEDTNLKTVYIRMTNDVSWDAQIIDYQGQKIKILVPKQ